MQEEYEPLILNDSLQAAVQRGDNATVQSLIATGADVNATNADGDKPLHYAALGGDTTTAQILIAAGAHVNATGTDGYTPLHVAAILGHTATAQSLIAAGANLNATDKYGNTPLNLARLRHHTELIAMLRYAQERSTILLPYALLIGLENIEHAEKMLVPNQGLSTEDNNLRKLLSRFTIDLPTELKHKVMGHLPRMTNARAISYCTIFNNYQQRVSVQAPESQATCTTTTSTSNNKTKPEDDDSSSNSPADKRQRAKPD